MVFQIVPPWKSIETHSKMSTPWLPTLLCLNDMLDGHYREIGVILTRLKMLTESSESPLWVGHPVGWSIHKSRFSKQSARPDYGSAQRSALDLVFLGVKEPTPIRSRDVDCSSRTSSACRAR